MAFGIQTVKNILLFITVHFVWSCLWFGFRQVVLVASVLSWIQGLLCKYVFLQDRGSYLAVTNR